MLIADFLPITEAEDAPGDRTFYHVTLNSRLPSIRQTGLSGGKKRLWKNTHGAALGERGAIYLFSDASAAVRWAAKMEYEFGKPVSILVLKDIPGGIERDGGMQLHAQRGTTWKTLRPIPAECIHKIVPLTKDLIRKIVADKPVVLEAGRGSSGAPLSATPANIARAKAFLLRKWKERWHERNPSGPTYSAAFGWNREPEDLTDACKFTSLFAQRVFGGQIKGTYHHQYVKLPDGQLLDLNIDAADVKSLGKGAHDHDPRFIGSRDHLESMASCVSRVDSWVAEFLATETAHADNGLPQSS